MRFAMILVLFGLPSVGLAGPPSFAELQAALVELLDETEAETPEQLYRKQFDHIQADPWRPPHYYRPVDLIEKYSRLEFHDQERNQKLDFDWPKYFIHDGALHYNLGALWCFELRERQSLDRAVQLEFVNQLHRRCLDRDRWERNFWNPVLDDATAITRKLYTLGKQSVPGDHFAEQDELVRNWKQVYVSALRDRAARQGVSKVVWEPPSRRPMVELVPDPALNDQIRDLWNTERFHVEIQDLLDSCLAAKLDGWPAPRWQPLPPEGIEAKGSVFVRTRVDRSLISLERIERAAKVRAPVAGLNRFYLQMHLAPDYRGKPLILYQGRTYDPPRTRIKDKHGIYRDFVGKPNTLFVR